MERGTVRLVRTMCSEGERYSVDRRSRGSARGYCPSSDEESWSYHLRDFEQRRSRSFDDDNDYSRARPLDRSRSPHRRSHQTGEGQSSKPPRRHRSTEKSAPYADTVHKNERAYGDERLSRPSRHAAMDQNRRSPREDRKGMRFFDNARSESDAASDSYSEGEIRTGHGSSEQEKEDYETDEDYETEGDYDEDYETEEDNGKGNANCYCELCDISVTSADQLQVHFDGQKHQKRLKRVERGEPVAPRPPNPSKKKSDGVVVDPSALTLVQCAVCKAELFSNELGPHIDCASHREAEEIWLKKGMELPSVRTMFVKQIELGDASAEVQEVSDDCGGVLICTVCNVTFSSLQSKEAHYKGKKHRKKLNQVEREKMPELFYCDICHLTCNSSKELKTHKRGKKHLARSAWKVNVEDTVPATIGEYEETTSGWQNAY